MNERIKKLAEQAGFIDRGTNHTAYMNFDHEKFAELIVKECLGIIEIEASSYAEPVWAYELVNDIKERFGVEE